MRTKFDRRDDRAILDKKGGKALSQGEEAVWLARGARCAGRSCPAARRCWLLGVLLGSASAAAPAAQPADAGFAARREK